MYREPGSFKSARMASAGEQAIRMNFSPASALPALPGVFSPGREVLSDLGSRSPRLPSEEGMLKSTPSKGARKALQFHTFDAVYVEKLCADDKTTQEHFYEYFSELMRIKLRSKLRSPQRIEDACQETFLRVYAALRNGGLRQPERLGSFVNSVCNNVLQEMWRDDGRWGSSLDDEESPEPADARRDALEFAATEQEAKHVRKILRKLPQRDREVLTEVFLNEKDREEASAALNVDRGYLRVLLHRSKDVFKTEYEKRFGKPSAKKPRHD